MSHDIGAEGRQTYITWVDRARTRRGRARRIQDAVTTLALDPTGGWLPGQLPTTPGPNGISM